MATKKGKVLNMVNPNIFSPATQSNIPPTQVLTDVSNTDVNGNPTNVGDNIQKKEDSSQYLPYFFLAGFVVVAYLVLKD